MLSRKTPEANLENKRSAWRALGFVASLSLLLSALAWTSYDVAITRSLGFEADLLEDEEIPVNIVQPPPPPPPPQQTTVIEIVDDEEEIEILN
jgi:protein TonB